MNKKNEEINKLQKEIINNWEESFIQQIKFYDKIIDLVKKAKKLTIVHNKNFLNNIFKNCYIDGIYDFSDEHIKELGRKKQ